MPPSEMGKQNCVTNLDTSKTEMSDKIISGGLKHNF
jgi:hypothetical protein